MSGQKYSPEEDTAIFALRALKWPTSKIAAALNRSLVSVERHLRVLKLAGSAHPFKSGPPRYVRQTASDAPIEGETWTDVPIRGLAVSSHGRVRTISTGVLRRLFTQSATGKPGVNYETAHRRGTISLAALIWEAAGSPPTPKATRPTRARQTTSRLERDPKGQCWYLPREVDVIRNARSLKAAQAALSHRSRASVKKKAWLLGVKFSKWEPALPGSGPKGSADYGAAKAAVPRWYRPEDRDDLINDIVMMQLEGFEGDANEAFKIARARHNKLFDEFRDKPIDAVIPGTDRLRYSDLLSADDPHF